MFKLDLILPIYFYNEFVENSLKSILNQTVSREDLIIIIVINSVELDVYEDLKSKILLFVEAHNANAIEFEIVYTSQSGGNNARLVGVNSSKSPYVMFMDSDDVLVDYDSLRSHINLIKNNPNIDILSFNFINAKYITFDELVFGKVGYNYSFSDKILKKSSDERIIINNFGTNVWSRIIKRNIISKFDYPDLPFFQDWNLTSKMYLNADIFYFVNKPLYVWIYRENSISHGGGEKVAKLHLAFNSIVNSIEYFKSRSSLKDSFLIHRIIHFCYEYYMRSYKLDYVLGMKESRKLLMQYVQLRDLKIMQLKTIIMYFLVKRSFLLNILFRLKKFN